jgi:hypothetical protein
MMLVLAYAAFFVLLVLVAFAAVAMWDVAVTRRRG